VYVDVERQTEGTYSGRTRVLTVHSTHPLSTTCRRCASHLCLCGAGSNQAKLQAANKVGQDITSVCQEEGAGGGTLLTNAQTRRCNQLHPQWVCLTLPQTSFHLLICPTTVATPPTLISCIVQFSPALSRSKSSSAASLSPSYASFSSS
jgi:hypothetical protein